MIKELSFKFLSRYGNNIIQLMNSLHVHINNKDSFLCIPNNRSSLIRPQIIDKHKNYFKTINNLCDFVIRDIKKQDIKYEKIWMSNMFNWKKHTKKYNSNYITFEDRIQYIDIICDEILELKQPKVLISDKDLLIHIRSTDIYKKNANPSYAQPPLSFYEKVIEDNFFSNIYLISDDNNNYICKLLKNKYSNTHYIYENNVKEAFNIIRHAKNVCTSVSSFCTTSVLLKPKKVSEKNIFTFEYLCYKNGVWHFDFMFDSKLKRPGYNFKIYKIENYPFMTKKDNEFISNWSFTEETRQIMLSHKKNNIVKLDKNEFR